MKNVYCEHPRKENLEKWSENAFFSPGTVPKRWKWPFLGSLFVKARLGFHFWKMNISNFIFYFILSFNSKKNGTKKESRMKWKMNEKWVKKVNCEWPYCSHFWLIFGSFWSHFEFHLEKLNPSITCTNWSSSASFFFSFFVNLNSTACTHTTSM